MIKEGDRVVVVHHEESPPTWKYAGQEGWVVGTISSRLYEETLYVEFGDNSSVYVAFREEDLARTSTARDERHSSHQTLEAL